DFLSEGGRILHRSAAERGARARLAGSVRAPGRPRQGRKVGRRSLENVHLGEAGRPRRVGCLPESTLTDRREKACPRKHDSEAYFLVFQLDRHGGGGRISFTKPARQMFQLEETKTFFG